MLAILFLLLLHTYHSIPISPSSLPTCLSGSLPTSPKPHLNYCRSFQSSSCCSRKQTSTIGQKIKVLYRQKYSACPACVHNLAGLQCNIACSPEQTTYISKSPPATHGGHRQLPIVRLCQSFCTSLFRSCGDVDLVDEKGSNSSVMESYYSKFNDQDEIRAAKQFCLDQFREFPEFTAMVVADSDYTSDSLKGNSCYGNTNAQEIADECDPYEDQRFLHVLSASIDYNKGLALGMVSVLLCLAAFCVGYNMMLVRRKANWLIDKQITEKVDEERERYAREDADFAIKSDENSSFLVTSKLGMN